MKSNNFINKIESSIKNNQINFTELFEILKKAELDDFDINLVFDEKNYTRNLVYKNDKFQLVLMCWPKNYESSIHDHNGSECFFKILKGVMLEKKYQISGNNLNLTDDKVINESTTSFLEKNDDIHQVKNIHNNFTITLHLYVPFYQKTNIYKINQDNSFTKELIELCFDN